MNQNVIIRIAQLNEMSWVNSQYDTVGFKHSNYDNELIAIAEVNGERVGVGRLQRVEQSAAELGGIFVEKEYRGLGLASKIVGFLVQNAHSYEKVFCLPFSHLSHFYQKFGFASVRIDELVPSSIANKHQWCNHTYDSETLLFVLHNQLKI
ncbi:GNAT family N-acetyltransferase [Photobacterium minamisatsumaniensis]|uniref:GNAT family N-acetyltransferase n=1 Tax=Photobacterium minamisatsumaniensis TaxID=2910233 RepID=UPI003D0D0509